MPFTNALDLKYPSECWERKGIKVKKIQTTISESNTISTFRCKKRRKCNLEKIEKNNNNKFYLNFQPYLSNFIYLFYNVALFVMILFMSRSFFKV